MSVAADHAVSVRMANRARMDRTDWAGLLPKSIAIRQRIWERDRVILRMHGAGLSFAEIGRRTKLARERVRQIVARSVRPLSPCEQYLARLCNVEDVAFELKKLAGREAIKADATRFRYRAAVAAALAGHLGEGMGTNAMPSERTWAFVPGGRMAEVHVLPGVERRDLAGPAEGDAVHILTAAIESGVTEVVIVGKARDGSQYVTTSIGDADRAAGIMLRAATWLTSIRIDNDVVVETDEGA